MMQYFDDGGSVSSNSGIAALPTISSGAQSLFNTALANAGNASVSQAAVSPYLAAQQGVGGLSNQVMQYSAPYGIGNLPAAQPAPQLAEPMYLYGYNLSDANPNAPQYSAPWWLANGATAVPVGSDLYNQRMAQEQAWAAARTAAGAPPA